MLRVILRASWATAILTILLTLIPSFLPQSFNELVLVVGSRGKTCNSQKFTVPHRFFSNFYLFAVIWTMSLLLMTSYYAHQLVARLDDEAMHSASKAMFLLLLMEVQVLRRLYETLCVFKYSQSARMHIAAYFLSLFYYTFAPLSLCSNCVTEVVKFTIHQITEFKIGISTLELDLFGYLSPLRELGWWQWIGATIFIWGSLHQCRCHAILGSLRKDKENSDEYVIPHGDWFEYVSCPHFLAEIVIYAGLLIASGGSDLTIWLLFGFVVANLVAVAAETQRWYLKKFDTYPKARRAIIPYIY